MRTILFFDDWPILTRQNINRRWFAAEPWPGVTPWSDPKVPITSVNTVMRDPATGRWLMWASGLTSLALGDRGFCLCLYESPDGFDWRPMAQDPLADPRATPKAPHMVFSGEHAGGGAMVFRDDDEPDPAMRYKFAYSDLSDNPVDSSYGACRRAISPDGIHWTIDRQAVWRRQHTDTGFSIVRNPYTGKYQWTSRPILGDRRICLDQTADWRHFERPMVVLHPDPMDPPGVEFYGMPQFLYEGYFVGFLWRMWGASNDLKGSTRFFGPVDTELTYSINGTCWTRTTRHPILPDRGLGKEGYRSEYPMCMVQDDEGWLRVYSPVRIGEHVDWKKAAPGENITFNTVSRFRRDGFCALESHSDTGTILMRGLLSRGGPILLNAIAGRFGRIRAELRTFDNTAIPGFELDKCVPVTGDGHFLPLRWNSGGQALETVDSLRGKPFRLYLELEQARVYAVRVDADLAYGFVPETNLAGDYLRGMCL
jgi:hypothetical protein